MECATHALVFRSEPNESQRECAASEERATRIFPRRDGVSGEWKNFICTRLAKAGKSHDALMAWRGRKVTAICGARLERLALPDRVGVLSVATQTADRSLQAASASGRRWSKSLSGFKDKWRPGKAHALENIDARPD